MKKHRLLLICLPVFYSFFTSLSAYSQGFTTNEYKKALWMTTRMYGGQRSGENNWLLYNHLPEGVAEKYRGTAFIEDKDTDGYDLSGGWHDCGDHVKFGHTEFYSGYVLLKGFAEFPAGYDDYYSYDYAGYKATGQWNWEGNGHKPNGIPDILEEVKHATDFYIKCARNSTTFYYQIGEGNLDHAEWVTATKMQTLPYAKGGQPRKVYKNPKDASMPSFCGSTLALMSRLYRKYDPAYADKCLVHAKYAYDYAKANPGTAGTGDGGFYSATENWKDDFSSLCAELYWATGIEAYKTEALSYTVGIIGQGKDIYSNSFGFDYSTNGELAIYNQYLLGKAEAKTFFDSAIKNNYLSKVGTNGVYTGGNEDHGPLRYVANAAFLVGLWQKMSGTDNTVHKFIYDNLDFILGKNSSNLSFVVGFGEKHAKFPHHRNLFLNDNNPTDAVKRAMVIPAKNAQFGYLVGAKRNPALYNDDLVDYKHTEGGIDYSAGLVGALAYINSVIAPVNTSKFGNTTPDLGSDLSICGLSSITLDSKVAVDNVKTFTWLKDGVVIEPSSATKNKLTVTTAGVYTCKLDSAGKFTTESTVEIFGVLGNVSLGAAKELCNPASQTLDAGLSGNGIRYEWFKDSKLIDGANLKTLTVYLPGTYKVIVSATGCASKSSEVVVTSKLPDVTHDTICNPGSVYLSVNGTGGPYEWYDSESGTGSPLKTGANYSTSINSNKTFYVKDAGSLSVTSGPQFANHTLTEATNGGDIGIRFKALKPFQITQLRVVPFVYSCNSGETVSVTFDLLQGGVKKGTYTSTPVACTGVQSGTPYTTSYVLNFTTPIEVAATGDYTLISTTGNDLVWFGGNANLTSMDAAGVMDITDDTRDDRAASFPGIFDIKLQAGSTCARTPVFAVIDGTRPECNLVSAIDQNNVKNLINAFPNPSDHNFTISSNFNGLVKVFDELGRQILDLDTQRNKSFGEDLLPGVYHLIFYSNGEKVNSFNVVKY